MTELANPLSAKMYKVVLLLENLNPVIKKYVVDSSETIEYLEVNSGPGNVHFHGIVKTQPEERLNSLGYPRIAFHADFSITKGSDHFINLAINKFRLTNPDKPSVDFMRIASKFIPGIKKYFLKELSDSRPELFSFPTASDKFVMDISYFINHVPTLMSSSFSEIQIFRVNASGKNRINFYIISNLLLIKAVDYFGPAYLSVEEIKDKDALELLWENETTT